MWEELCPVMQLAGLCFDLILVLSNGYIWATAELVYFIPRGIRERSVFYIAEALIHKIGSRECLQPIFYIKCFGFFFFLKVFCFLHLWCTENISDLLRQVGKLFTTLGILAIKVYSYVDESFKMKLHWVYKYFLSSRCFLILTYHIFLFGGLDSFGQSCCCCSSQEQSRN